MTGDLVWRPTPLAPSPDAVPDNTSRAYGRWWVRYLEFCAVMERTALPSTGETLTDFIGHLLDDEQLGPSSLRQAIAAIRSKHAMQGYPDQPPAYDARLLIPGKEEPDVRSRRSRMRLTITPSEAAAVDRLLNAYGDDADPGTADLISLREKIRRLEQDHTAYDDAATSEEDTVSELGTTTSQAGSASAATYRDIVEQLPRAVNGAAAAVAEEQ